MRPTAKTALAFASAFFVATLFTGCATNFEKQLSVYENVETARAKEGGAKYAALQSIATGADASTKQVALQAWQAVAMTEQLGGSNHRAREAMPAPPPTAFDRGLQALSIVAPIAANVYGAYYGKTIAVNASNNAAAVAINEATARTAQLGVVRDTGIGVATAAGGAFANASAGYAQALNNAINRPTYQITTTGNGNTVAGRDATTTTTTTTSINCPQAATAYTGTAGQGGNGSGAPGSTGGAGGTSAPATASPSVNCARG